MHNTIHVCCIMTQSRADCHRLIVRRTRFYATNVSPLFVYSNCRIVLVWLFLVKSIWIKHNRHHICSLMYNASSGDYLWSRICHQLLNPAWNALCWTEAICVCHLLCCACIRIYLSNERGCVFESNLDCHNVYFYWYEIYSIQYS